MLTMVIAKPIALTMVSAVPLYSKMALSATSVENKGESAITSIPQHTKKLTNKTSDPELKTKGDTKQQTPDNMRVIVAIRLAPND